MVTTLQKKDKITIENAQRRVTRLVQSLKGLCNPERLICIGLPTLEYRRERADVVEVYKMLRQRPMATMARLSDQL